MEAYVSIPEYTTENGAELVRINFAALPAIGHAITIMAEDDDHLCDFLMKKKQRSYRVINIEWFVRFRKSETCPRIYLK